MQAILKLSRWQEFIPFTLPLSLLGALMAYRFMENITLDWQLGVVILANFLAVGYAFMVNDIEDAEDDKHDPERAARNAISMGELSKKTAWLASLAVAGGAALLYALVGWRVFGVGMLTLLLSHFYSWKPVRLKALPVVDILSHVLMLSGLLMLAPYLAYHATLPWEVWLLFISVSLFSGYGQFYNQARDFEADRAAGLKNTASLLGKQATHWVSYASVGVAVICLIIPIIYGAFPLELLPILIVATPIGYYFGRGKDMRGDKASDEIGEGQVQFLIVVNLVLLAWLFYVFYKQLAG